MTHTKWSLEPAEDSLFPESDIEEEATQWLIDNPDATEVDVDEYRPPTHEDLADAMLASVLAVVTSKVQDATENACETLHHDDGGPEIATPRVASEGYAALRDGLRTGLIAYLREHADIRGACWQPTGRSVKLTRAELFGLGSADPQ